MCLFKTISHPWELGEKGTHRWIIVQLQRNSPKLVDRKLHLKKDTVFRNNVFSLALSPSRG